LAGRSSSDPIRWRPGADPGQKQDTGDRITLKGIDTQTPVTEEYFYGFVGGDASQWQPNPIP